MEPVGTTQRSRLRAFVVVATGSTVVAAAVMAIECLTIAPSAIHDGAQQHLVAVALQVREELHAAQIELRNLAQSI